MAEIDKALPNSKRTTIELPDQKDIQEALAQEINRDTASVLTETNRSCTRPS